MMWKLCLNIKSHHLLCLCHHCKAHVGVQGEGEHGCASSGSKPLLRVTRLTAFESSWTFSLQQRRLSNNPACASQAQDPTDTDTAALTLPCISTMTSTALVGQPRASISVSQRGSCNLQDVEQPEAHHRTASISGQRRPSSSVGT